MHTFSNFFPEAAIAPRNLDNVTSIPQSQGGPDSQRDCQV